MKRKIIQIDRNVCVGCGACAAACREGAIGMVDGKAALLREDHCDGLGNCLPHCPVNAISFIEKEVEHPVHAAPAAGCPGSASRPLNNAAGDLPATGSALAQWPVQLRLVPVRAPYFDGADLLVAADCSAYAYGSFHRDYMAGKATIIGCPKLDEDYTEKLTAILRENDIKSVTLTRMEVPCCGGLERALRQAVQHCGKRIPLTVDTLSVEGALLGRQNT